MDYWITVVSCHFIESEIYGTLITHHFIHLCLSTFIRKAGNCCHDAGKVGGRAASSSMILCRVFRVFCIIQRLRLSKSFVTGTDFMPISRTAWRKSWPQQQLNQIHVFYNYFTLVNCILGKLDRLGTGDRWGTVWLVWNAFDVDTRRGLEHRISKEGAGTR